MGLFKLHGSIDLFRTQNGNIIHHTALGREDTTSLGEKIEEEVIMYPVEASGYALSSQSPFLDLFRIFRDRISKDNIWIIIGFSFRDKTITSIFNDVLRTREDRERVKVVFIDPLSEKIKEKLREDGFHYLGEKIETSKFKFVEEDPYLGYLHSIQFAKPSLVCDIQEIFRGMIDEFLIDYGQRLNENSFENKGERMFLKRKESYKVITAINGIFDKRIKHQRIKKYGQRSKMRTVIREEPIKLGQYIREEKSNYEPTFLGVF